MNEIILLMIVLAAIAYLAEPYWRKKVIAPNRSNVQLADLIERRNSLLAQIKEIEFDHEVGKVSAEDFSEINARYRSEAIGVLRRIDALQGNKRSRQKLEAELQSMRSRRKKGTMFCSQCGTAFGPKDRFCSNCGNRIRK
ncbi:MAG: zinc ribbon domain-containing protein [bacterium]